MSIKNAFKKGRRAEKEFCNMLISEGLNAKVMPVYLNDLRPGGADLILENKYNLQVKNQKKIPSYLWEWLENNHFLVLKDNHKEFLVTMRFKEFVSLFKIAFKAPRASQDQLKLQKLREVLDSEF